MLINLLFPTQYADDICTTISSVLRCYTMPACIMTRLKTILLINNTGSLTTVAMQLGVSCSFVAKWRDRVRSDPTFSLWPADSIDLKEKQQLICNAVVDAPRLGAPTIYTAEQMCNLMALPLKPPSECVREITHWTNIELADEANRQGIAPGISKSTVQRFLKQSNVRPHHSIYWLNPKIEDEETFKKEVNNICDTYHQAPLLDKENVRTVSVDEKTGIQALQRITPSKPMQQGSVEKRDHV